MPTIPLRTTSAIALAAGAYTANVALGLAVAARLVDTRRVRWVHHGLFITTCVTTAAAITVGAARGDRSVMALVPAAVPLVLLQHDGARPVGRHARTALAAAPFYAAAVAVSALRPSPPVAAPAVGPSRR